MIYDFSPVKKKVKDTEEWLKKEQAQIRTGRASASLLDSIMVDVYGSKTPLQQMGSITIEDPRSLRVSIWDQSQIKNAEKAIGAANLGVSVQVDDKGVRVSFPELTSERRMLVIKTAKEKLEQGKISLRKVRDEAWTDIQNREKEGGMSEDEKFRFKGEMEKIIQEGTKALDDLHARKEKEITN
jgi:ribosome recycling factor